MTSPLHVITPLLESIPLSRKIGMNVYLKMENVQPSGSFKIRGLGRCCQEAAKVGVKRLICASGGNAGLAVALSGRRLGIPVTVVVPHSTSAKTTIKLEDEGATVKIYGENFDEAYEFALQMAENPDFRFIHPFDDPLVWEGHKSIIQELKEQLNHQPPSCIVTACGGGGLVIGCIEGLKAVGWNNVPIIAIETKGTDSLNASIKANRLVTLPKITSICNCLAAKTVARKLFNFVGNYPIFSCLVEDKDAVSACRLFLDDHYALVDLACGAAMSALYGNTITELISENKIDVNKPIVAIVCGGTGLSHEMLDDLTQKYEFF